jgi:hypothetical protein
LDNCSGWIYQLDGITIVIQRHFLAFSLDGFFFSRINCSKFIEQPGSLRKITGCPIGILTATHVFAGLSRALRNKTNTVAIGDLVAETLRIFGHGTKVACEISMMAADAGLVRTDEDIISVGGTGKGSDTALVLTPFTSQNFFDLKIKEILCKPHF